MERLDQPTYHDSFTCLYYCILDWKSQVYEDYLNSNSTDVSAQCSDKRFAVGNTVWILHSDKCCGGAFSYWSAQRPYADKKSYRKR